MKPIQIISQDLFDKIRSRFTNLEMGDETGAVTIDPAMARFFDFDYVQEGINLGRVSISLNDLGRLKIYYSQGITENQDEIATRSWYNFLKEMRFFAMRRLLRFDTRDIAKSNLDRNDFQYLAAKGPKEEETMNIKESRWSKKSSRKTSRAVNGATEVIVRHAHPVEETYPGARSQRKNIKAIFIQNREGERFKYPFIHPAGAFAMAQHVDHGGVPHDPAGRAIIRMSEQIAQLQEFQRQVRPASLHDDAMGITERAMVKLDELKSCVANLSKRKYYESWLAEFNETEEPMLGELDAVTMETYKQKFTQSSFNENLAALFPLIHSIMQEANTVDLEEYVGEGEGTHTVHCSQCGGEFKSDKATGFSHCKDHAGMKNYDVDEAVDDFARFESWAEAVEQGRLTDDQVKELKSALENLESSGQKLELGPDGQTAWEFFSSFGLEDSDLQDKLKSMSDIDPETDPIQVLQAWANDNYPELLVALGMSGTTEPAAQAAPDAVPPAEQPVAEDQGYNAIIKEVAKIVNSFYNRSNESVGPFRAPENIALDCKKRISEKFGEAAGVFAENIAKEFINKLSNEWAQRHGQTIAGETKMPKDSTPGRMLNDPAYQENVDEQAAIAALKQPSKNKEQGVAEDTTPQVGQSVIVNATDYKLGPQEQGIIQKINPRGTELLVKLKTNNETYIFSPDDIVQGVGEGLEPEKRKRLDDLIDQYRSATDPSDYYDREYSDPEEVIELIKLEFGDKVASQVEAGADKMHFSRPGHTSWKADPLGWKKPVDRMTKAGKMYKQDSDYRKNTIKSRYKLSGKSATEGVAENSLEMASILKLAGLNK